MESRVPGISQFLIQVQGDDREALLDYAIAEGHGVEIADFTRPDLLDDERACARLVAWYRERLGQVRGLVSFHGAFRELLPSATDAKVRAAARNRVAQTLAIAEETGASSIVFHSDFNLGGDSAAWAQRQAAFWRETTAQRTIGLLLENCVEPGWAVVKAAIDAIGLPSVGVCFDAAHANLAGRIWATWTGDSAWESPADWLTHLGSLVRCLHLSDNDLTGDTHLAPGHGKVGWKAFLGALADTGLQLPAAIEVAGIEGARETIAYLRSLW
jgi:sugar phosphate isomerase/epimerase